MYKFFKRACDIIFAFLFLIIASPIFLIIAIAIKIDSKGPIVFTQQRLGLKGKVFKMHKFRTMVVGAEHTGTGVYSNKGDTRVTKVGRFLRATSLDELLQLWDILIGKMSFIGPRPALTYHPWTIDKYTQEQMRMFDVRPGITGWAAVNGRKSVEWNKRIELNVWYVDNLSLWLDIKILFKTVFKVFSNADNVNNGATVKKDNNTENKNLKLMYITNNTQIATIAEQAGVDRIFIDMEYIGKDLRQGGLDTVQNHHTIEDVKIMAKTLKTAELLVRINPLHSQTENYCSSKKEIEEAISSGAKVLMLPYFKTVEEVEEFISYVNGRAKTLLLIETVESVELLDQILKVKGIDEIHIGLNDLSLAKGKKFMFELLADGTVEEIIKKIKPTGITYGFGGVARLHKGILPAEYILAEHKRLGSSMAILSRSFCDATKITDLNELMKIFDKSLKEIRDYENNLPNDEQFYLENKKKIENCVIKYLESL